MKSNHVGASLGLDLLRYVRDAKPTEEELARWLGPSDIGRYHTLRKAGLLLLRENTVVLYPEHLTPDGKHFDYGNRRFNLDEDSVWYFVRRSVG